MKEFLSRAGYAFTVRDVDEDADAYDELVARGFLTVPVTLIDDVAIRGFDEAELRRALDAQGS